MRCVVATCFSFVAIVMAVGAIIRARRMAKEIILYKEINSPGAFMQRKKDG